jgi:hypothetical protein
MKLYFDDADFDGQLQRSVGKADSGMANVGECLAIAERITPGDRDSWYRAWSGFAGRLAEQGQAALAAGHRISARGALLRAAEYFRQAFFFHRDNLDGAELRTAYASSVQAFRDALPLLDHRAEVLADGLSGYLFTPRHADGPLPAVLHIDSSLFVVSRASGKVAASPLLFSGGVLPTTLVERGDDVRGEHRHLAGGRSRI